MISQPTILVLVATLSIVSFIFALSACIRVLVTKTGLHGPIGEQGNPGAVGTQGPKGLPGIRGPSGNGFIWFRNEPGEIIQVSDDLVVSVRTLVFSGYFLASARTGQIIISGEIVITDESLRGRNVTFTAKPPLTITGVAKVGPHSVGMISLVPLTANNNPIGGESVMGNVLLRSDSINEILTVRIENMQFTERATFAFTIPCVLIGF